MQNKENSTIDARTFQQIWMSLGTRSCRQLELRDELVRNMNISRQTVHNWGTGQTKPIYDDVKKKVANIINRTLGISVSYKTLFM